jgi:uncharacterized protein (TIGR03435 family)
VTSRNFPEVPTATKRIFVATAAALFVFNFVLVQLRAQTTQASVTPISSFEVVSLKPNRSGQGGSNWSLTGPYVLATNIPARALIEMAYAIKDFQLSGAPAWINSERFDLNAKIDDSLAAQLANVSYIEKFNRIRPMLQSMLADRFKLKVGRETKELPVLALVIAKHDADSADAKLAKLKVDPWPNNPDGGTMMSIGRNGQRSIQGNKVSMDNFASGLSRLLNQQVLNQTGIDGNYEFTIAWTDDAELASDAASESLGPSLSNELLDKLSLKLQSTKGPVEIIVIDHIEEPSPN